MILVSVFRDSEHYIDRYMEQLYELRKHTEVTAVAVEGDSVDNTFKALKSLEEPWLHILKAEHGGAKYPSLDIPLRWRQIASVCNIGMCAAVRLNMETRGPIVYVESDLLWESLTMLRLVGHLEQYPAVAPMSMSHGRFWDIWGHTKDGRGFSSHPPYHPAISGTNMVPIDTAGSCIAMRAECADVVEFSAIDCIRGVGRSLAANGYTLWLDPTLNVIQP